MPSNLLSNIDIERQKIADKVSSLYSGYKSQLKPEIQSMLTGVEKTLSLVDSLLKKVSETPGVDYMTGAYLPGGPKNNVLKHLLTQTERVGTVKVPTKMQLKKVLDEAYLPSSVEDIAYIRNLTERAFGIEKSGLKLINSELIAKNFPIQPDAPAKTILEVLHKMQDKFRQVLRHERSHTATIPIVGFIKGLVNNADSLDADASKVLWKFQIFQKLINKEYRAYKLFGPRATDLEKMTRAIKTDIPGNLYETTPEAINNLWIVYNTTGGRKIMGKYPVGKAAMDFFDELSQIEYKPNP